MKNKKWYGLFAFASTATIGIPLITHQVAHNNANTCSQYISEKTKQFTDYFISFSSDNFTLDFQTNFFPPPWPQYIEMTGKLNNETLLDFKKLIHMANEEVISMSEKACSGLTWTSGILLLLVLLLLINLVGQAFLKCDFNQLESSTINERTPLRR